MIIVSAFDGLARPDARHVLALKDLEEVFWIVVGAVVVVWDAVVYLHEKRYNLIN